MFLNLHKMYDGGDFVDDFEDLDGDEGLEVEEAMEQETQVMAMDSAGS